MAAASRACYVRASGASASPPWLVEITVARCKHFARRESKHAGIPKYEAELSYGHSNLGSIYEALGDDARAEAEYRTSVDVDRRRVARDPRNDQTRADLANSLNTLAIRLSALGRHEAALVEAQEAAGLYSELAAARPDAFRPNLAAGRWLKRT